MSLGKGVVRGYFSREIRSCLLCPLVIPWYTRGMKTAISLPDELFASVDALARKLGLSRSRLIAEALAEYLAKHRTSRVTERLNAVYASDEAVVDKALQKAQRRAVRRSEW